MQGQFIISLDFELHWGVFDKVDFEQNINYFENTKAIIPKILLLFEQNNIACTWATVGMLFYRDFKEWQNGVPNLKPTFLNKSLSAYEWVEKNNTKNINTGHFAPELINQIIKTKYQELASHTFAHYYCLEKGQNVSQFESDTKSFSKVISEKNLKAQSLVFPRNQYNSSYLDVCAKNDIKIVRTNPNVWFWNVNGKENLLKKIFRTLDCYIPLFRSTYKLKSVKKINKIVLLPSSRFLKPYGKHNVLNKLRLRRIMKEMTHAAKKGEIYHLWWHPHNFGNYTKQSIKDLKLIANHYKYLEKKYKMKSSNMITFYNEFFD